MKKTLNILLLFIAILFTVWMVVDNDGIVTIEWIDFQIETSFVFAILTILFLMIICSFILNIFAFIKKIPTQFYTKRQKKKHSKQLHLLVDCLLTLTLNEHKQVDKLLKRLNENDIRFDSPQLNIMSIYLIAKLYQNVKLLDISSLKFGKIIHYKGFEVIGYKGLIENNIAQEKYLDAMINAENMLKYNQNNSWLLNTLFDLYINLKFWQKAEKILQKIQKNNTTNIQEKYCYLYDMQIIHLVNVGETSEIISTLENGLKNNYLSFKMITKLCKLYLENNKPDKAYKIIIKLWEETNNTQYLFFAEKLFNGDSSRLIKLLDNINLKTSKSLNIVYAKIMINIKEYEKAAQALQIFTDDDDPQIANLMLIISAKSNNRLSEISTWADKVKFYEDKTTITSNH